MLYKPTNRLNYIIDHNKGIEYLYDYMLPQFYENGFQRILPKLTLAELVTGFEKITYD